MKLLRSFSAFLILFLSWIRGFQILLICLNFQSGNQETMK